jgi:hypothetical protein
MKVGDIVDSKEDTRFRTSQRHGGTNWFLTICGIKKLMPFKEIGKDYSEASKN